MRGTGTAVSTKPASTKAKTMSYSHANYAAICSCCAHETVAGLFLQPDYTQSLQASLVVLLELVPQLRCKQASSASPTAPVLLAATVVPGATTATLSPLTATFVTPGTATFTCETRAAAQQKLVTQVHRQSHTYRVLHRSIAPVCCMLLAQRLKGNTCV
jgi:hypothetical protein